jgi:pyridoxal phosphate enzyme (YggS family)
MSNSSPASGPQGIEAVRTQITKAAKRAGRSSNDITLVAVSKTFPADDVEPVLARGQRVFGENRVQEAQGKWPALRDAYPDCEVHLIGPLQSNKAKDAVATFDAIHSVDRIKIARALASEMETQDRRLPVFLQINTGEEDQKAGVMPAEADDFIRACRDDFSLTVAGLMCIPPVNENPALHFALLASIAERNGLAGLSMGMSGDFETAIELGATHVRVGSAIFGARPRPV